MSSAKKQNEDETPGSNWRNLLTPNKTNLSDNNGIDHSSGKTNSHNVASGHEDSLGHSKLLIREECKIW